MPARHFCGVNMSAISEWNTNGNTKLVSARKQGTPLLYLLGFVMALFIGILVFAYVVTKQTNPIFLDEHGQPANAPHAHAH